MKLNILSDHVVIKKFRSRELGDFAVKKKTKERKKIRQ